MPKFIDETGNEYGRLTGIGKAGNDRHGNTQWNCVCICGKKLIVLGGSLRQHHTQSCGCLAGEKTRDRCALPMGTASRNSLYATYKRNAAVRGIGWKLLKEDFALLTSGNCYWCGATPSQIHHHPRFNGAYIYNGVDRVDNDIGYVMSNCVPCCISCNRAKGRLSADDFLTWIQSIYERNNDRRRSG